MPATKRTAGPAARRTTKRTARQAASRTTKLVTLTALSATCWMADLASAENGGERSVLSWGTGNRAQALGGAYTALAEDASAPLWNAAGLAKIERKMIGAHQTQINEFGADEAFFGVVFPHWRFGTMAATVRHFGVSGVERRDDRNQLLDSDVAHGETEFAFAYGRHVRSLGLGTTLRFHRQQVDEASVTGFGLDLGTLARVGDLVSVPEWMEPLQLGLQARNIVAPKFRLDEDEVTESRSVRLGASYLAELGSSSTLLFTTDVERFGSSSAGFALGAEYRPNGTIHLRLGGGAHGLQAGSGFQWNDFGFDYAFDGNEVGNLHSLGVSWSFGIPKSDAELASIEETRTRYRAELSEDFHRAREERIQGLWSAAASARKTGNYREALETISVLQAIEPNMEEASLLESRIWADIGKQREAEGDLSEALVAYDRARQLDPEDEDILEAIERCNEASALANHRDEQRQALFSKAISSFSAGELLPAISWLDQLLIIDPHDEAALSLRSRALTAIEARVAELIDRADSFQKRNLFEDADALLSDAERLDPAGPAVREARENHRRARARFESERKRVEQERRASREREVARSAAVPESASASVEDAPSAVTSEEPAAGQTAREEEPAQLSEAALSNNYDRALRFLTKGNEPRAEELLDEIFAEAPDYRDTRLHLKRIYIVRGMDLFAGKDFAAAAENWERAAEIDPSDERVQGYLARARQHLARTIEILEPDGNKDGQ